MRKIVALGVNSSTNKCTRIYSSASFEELKDNINKYNIKCDATNWCGNDDISRTIELEKIKLGEVHLLNEPYEIEGYDSDWGHKYYWNFKFDTIVEVL